MSENRANTPTDTGAATWTPSFNPWLIAASVMLATFMEVLDTSVANVSLPHIAGSLSATTDEATWVLTSYLVSNAIVLPATNWLASFFGRKRLLIYCIIIFTLSSGLCGAATSLGLLVTARILQGIGGGALQPIAQAVMLESFPPAKRGQAMAVYGMGIIVAPIIGPTLGGWITDSYSWRWIFYINVPVGVLAVLMAQTFIEDPPYIRRNTRGTIDYIGLGLLSIWLATFQIVLDKGQEEDWFATPWVVWFTVLSVASFIAFIYWELRAEHPIVNLRVFADRNFRVGVVLIGVVGAVLYGTTAMLPIFMQTLMGYPSLESGLAVSPRGLGSMVSMILVGRLITKVDTRLLMAFGFSVLAISVYLLSGINLNIAIGNVIWPNIINGFALGFIFVPLTTTTMATLSNEQMGNASGLYNLMRNLGGSVGISAAATFLSRWSQSHQALLTGHLTPYDPIFIERLNQLQQSFSTQFGPVAGQQRAYAVLYGILVRQASLLAFVNIFRALALACLLCVPLVLVFRRIKSGGRAAAAMH